MPGTTRELSNSSDMPRITTIVGDEVLPAMDGAEQPIAIPTSLLHTKAQGDALSGRVDTLETGQTTGLLFYGTWAELQAEDPGVDGAGGGVSELDTGSHAQATATGYDGASVKNRGKYRWDESWSRWVRVADGSLSYNDVSSLAAFADPDLAVIPDGEGGYIVPAYDQILSKDEIWIDGSRKPSSQVLSDNGDGSFDLISVPAGLNSGYTLFVEYTSEGYSGAPSGGYAGLSANKTSLVGETAMGVYEHTASGALGVAYSNRMTSPVSSANGVGWGSERACLSVPESGNFLRKIEGSPVVSGAATATYLAPIFMTIGAYARNTRLPLTNAGVKRVIVYPGALTEAQIEKLFEITHPDYGLDQAVVPNWVPRVPHEDLPGYRYADLAFDYNKGRCWFNGRERAFDDVFVDAAGGDFTLVKPTRRLTASTGITFGADVRRTDFYDETQSPSGFVFNGLLAAGVTSLAERLEFNIFTHNIPGASGSPVEPGGLANTSSFVAKAGQVIPLSSAVSTNGGFLSRGQGIYRYGMAVPASGAILTFTNAGSVKSNTTVATYVPQDWFRFGAKVDGTSPIQNAEIVQGFMFSKALTESQMNALKVFNEYGAPPLLFVGDSINNVQQPAEMLALHWANEGISYVPWWSQGQGGRGLNYFEEFIEEIVTFDDNFRDYILVMVEGGFDYEGLNFNGSSLAAPLTEREVQSHLRAIRGKFREPRWVWMESSFNRVAELDIAAGNTEGMDQLRATMANIRETYPAAYCYTNALIQAQAQTDAEYDAIRVDGRNATHLRGDGIHGPWGLDYSGDPADESWYYWWSKALQHHLTGMNYPPMTLEA